MDSRKMKSKDDTDCDDADCCLTSFTLLSFFAAFGLLLAGVVVFGTSVFNVNDITCTVGGIDVQCSFCEFHRNKCIGIVVCGSLGAAILFLGFWCISCW